jgi:predicted O-methyltransferase YrrM
MLRSFHDLPWIVNPPLLDSILARTTELGFDMGSEPRTGALLRALAASKPAANFLELGTGTGIATAWLLEGMDAASTLTSVDTNPEAQAVAQTFLGGDHRLKLVLEDGRTFLQRQPSETYDFVFADAMPGKYEVLSDCLHLVKPGGFYVIDDMLQQPNWPKGHAEKVPRLLDQLASHPDFVIAPIVWASGIVLAVKR